MLYGVGTILTDHAANSHRVCEKFGYLAQAAFFVDGSILPRVEICVPIQHIDQRFLHDWFRIFKFGKFSIRPYIVVILVGLP